MARVDPELFARVQAKFAIQKAMILADPEPHLMKLTDLLIDVSRKLEAIEEIVFPGHEDIYQDVMAAPVDIREEAVSMVYRIREILEG